MEETLENIKNLIAKKEVENVEKEIMFHLINLEPFLVNLLDETRILNVEKILLSLFTLNEGIFSIQCAIFIATNLLKIYKNMKIPKLWDTINFTIQNTKSTTIIATGYLCRYIGESNRAQLPRFAEHILKNCSKYQFASIYTLRNIFKVGGKSVVQFANPAFDFVTKIMANTSQHTLMMGIKCLRTLISLDTVPIPNFVETARNCLLKESELPFIKNELAILVARCVYRPFELYLQSRETENSEWIVMSKRSNAQLFDFQQTLEIINTFPTIAPQIFNHFISFLGTEVTSLNHIQLFKYVRDYIPSEISKLIPLLPGDSKYKYFREILKENLSVSQLRLLKILSPDDSSIKDTSKIALQLAISPNKEANTEANDYFASLSNSHPFLINNQVGSSLSFLIKTLNNLDNQATQSEENNKLENAILGHSAIISSILANMAQTEKEATIHSNKKLLESFIKNSLSKSTFKSSFNTAMYTAVFRILSVLPKQFAALLIISKAIDSLISPGKPFDKRLLKAVFAFRAKFSKPAQNIALINFVIKAYNQIPVAILTNLCSMIPKVKMDQKTIYIATQSILKRAMITSPSHSLIKSFYKHPLPLASELLGAKPQKLKTDAFLNHMIRKFPLLLVACEPEDQKTLMSTVLAPKNQNSTTLLILASMCEAKSTRALVPLNLHKYLFSLMTPKNTSLFQSICESIALFARYHIDTLPDIFDFIESQKNLNGCLLISALFAHVTVPQQFLLRAINYLNGQLNAHGSIAMAVHALNSILLTHSMHLTAIGKNNYNQFPHLFATMQNLSSLQPVTLKIIGDCFRTLIETLSSELVDPNSVESRYVIISIKTIEFTPIKYAKEVYFNCCRAIYSFAHNLNNNASIIGKFPMSNSASIFAQLAASEAFSDYMKFESATVISSANTEIKKLDLIVPLLLSLLQKTADIRAHNFLLSIASTMTEENVSFWVSTVRRILVTSSLIDSPSLGIEPIHEVKKACVDISMYIVKIIANAFVLSTENLDDIISSLCRANETGSVQLQEAAFPVLQKVIELFKNKFTEDGGRILDLYDSQFASVVKVGFQLNLSISGGFLSSYLSFNTDNMSMDPENSSAILVVYLNGLDGCQQRSAPFYSLATHLCSVGRKYPQIRSLIEPFLTTLAPIFSGIVLKSMELWRDRNDWRMMNEFRALSAAFYCELLPAFVWLQTISKTIVIEVNTLVSFFIIEMKFAREEWQRNAAFEALSAALDFCGSDIPPELLELSLKSIINFKGADEKHFLNSIASLLKDSQEYDSLRECILSLCSEVVKTTSEAQDHTSLESIFTQFSINFINKANEDDKNFLPKLLGNLLKSDYKRKSLHSFVLFIVDLIIREFKANRLQIEQSEALIVALFNHSPDLITTISTRILDMKGLPINFKLQTAASALKFLVISDDPNNQTKLGSIPMYLISTFKKGGMHLIGSILINRPKLGVQLLSKGSAKAAFLLAQKDLENSRAFLWFIQLSLKVLEKEQQSNNVVAQKFALSVFRLSVKIIETCGNDPLNGRMTVWHCIRMIKDAVRIAGSKQIKKIFETELNQAQKLNLSKIIQKNINNEVQNRKMQELVEFSTNDRGRKYGEWQTLEIED